MHAKRPWAERSKRCAVADEHEAFLTVIRSDPNDPTSYLVFADWLDDHAEPREAQFHRSVGRHLETHRRLPGRAAHWLPPGQDFPVHVYADDDRFAVSRYHGGPVGPSLLVVDLNDAGERGLARRHRGFQSMLAVAVREFEPLPTGVSWSRVRGDVCGGAEFVGTFGERAKAFADPVALVEAMRVAFDPGGAPPA